jgi:Amt family ammonium transporter
MVMTSCGNARHTIQQSRPRNLAFMITTLRTNFKDPVRRKLVGARMGGKMIGVALVVGLIYAFAYIFSTEAAHALPVHNAATDIKEQLTGTINGLNTAWVLITAFLVFFMQAGFMMLEGGFARTREVSNVMIECIVDTALCGILFYAFGFAFMFGPGNGWIGYHYFFLQDVPHTYTYGGLFDTGVAFMAFFLFQFAFADTASTIVSGAMVGRTNFKGDLMYSLVVSGFIYPIFGHWIWGPNGWLGKAGVSDLGDTTPFRDFAGSTTVHTIGGVLAICGAIALGPRLGRKFKRDGGGMPPGHNMTLAALGAVILWFGWYGFNPGSTLSAIDAEGIGRVATNTTLAACAGCLVAVAWAYPRSKKWDVGISINGLLAGLVAITCPCYWVSPTGSIAIGAIAGAIMILAVDFTEWIRVDDPCGAFAVHGMCGIFGTLSLGFFAVGN